MDFYVKWILIILYAINALVVVATIGKPRRPLTPRLAAINLAVAATMALAVALTWDTSR
ncbi:hypothetical protein KBX50_04715 [Micromonospora sp. C51]|uniref:hypothetical protein n=1 Tax=Micromonospora sp. C51 TaxID=2824879 RepID=UPI001B3798D0|nr:hypothetical protein [Micromonospora sp. C51]MBQ1047791.1 hypothetical protein [Micromonospora sp. C51]